MNRKLARVRAGACRRADPLRQESAFSLIELLVVIALLALLASLLLPALARARLVSDSAVCKSNLRQLMHALNLYVQQEGVYPNHAFANNWRLHWSNVAQPPANYKILPDGTYHYLGAAVNSIWACPGYLRLGGAIGLGAEDGSYGYNYVGAVPNYRETVSTVDLPLGLGGSGKRTFFNAQLPETDVVNPSDMIAMGDVVLAMEALRNGAPLIGFQDLDAFIANTGTYASVMPGLPASEPAVRGMKQRHGGRWNISFCDGHVESLRASNVFNIRDARQMQRWNFDNQPHNEGLVLPPPAPGFPE